MLTAAAEDQGSWWADAPAGRPGPQRHPARWLVIGGLVVTLFAGPAVQDVLGAGMSVPMTVLALALIAAYGAGFLAFPFAAPRLSLPYRIVGCLVMLALGWMLVAVLGLDSFTALLFATSIIAFVLPSGWVLLIAGGTLVLLTAVLAGTGRMADEVGDLITMASITLALFFMGRLVRVIGSLRAAQAEIATLAAATERERVARDLHDVLGHGVTTITVKAGLARRLLESSADVDRAIGEIRDVEGLSRRVLTDIRATVSEYREVSLSAEVAGARAALRAAEIGADLPHAVDDVRPELQPVFGHVLREAVTNVLRHAAAGSVRVRLGQDWIEVRDDGPAAAQPVAGNGLRGLAERLAEVGGALRAGPGPGGGFVVRAEVPAGGDRS